MLRSFNPIGRFIQYHLHVSWRLQVDDIDSPGSANQFVDDVFESGARVDISILYRRCLGIERRAGAQSLREGASNIGSQSAGE
jgi:hypothetical protein